jgi:hypothetical protein
MKRWIGVLIGVWFLVLVGLGCSPTSDTGPNGHGPISRDTPDHLLNFLAVAYADRDADKYDEAMHEKFQFVFTQDIAEELGLPPEQPWWGKTKDLASTVKMFNSSEVTQILMDYVPEAERHWEAVDIERPDGSTYSGVFARVEPDIRVTIEKPDEEPTTYVVNESWLDVYMVRDPNYPNEVLWVFLEIQEIPKNPE